MSPSFPTRLSSELGGQIGQKLDALCGAVEVFVAPLPLIAGHLDGQIGAGRVFHGDDSARCRQRHADDDQERNDRPGDFNADMLVKFRSEEHTSELQSLMRTSYAVFFLIKKK